MNYDDFKMLKLHRLRSEMKIKKIEVSELAVRLNRTITNVSSSLNATKTFSERFIHDASLAIGVHPDRINSISEACIAAAGNIQPHEIPQFIPSPPRPRKSKKKTTG